MNKLLTQDLELSALRGLSARLGANPLLTQASSGNISVKTDDSLWIKASGKWLVHADADDFLIEVGLSRARRCVRQSAPIPESVAQQACRSRASIETAMHAVLPHKVVVHVHSVNSIAWAVRRGAAEQLASCLAGLEWLWIPYTPSGNALANAITDRLSRSPRADVFLLGNHGLVVCGDSCQSVERLLAEVENRLATSPRASQPVEVDLLAADDIGANWFVPDSAEIQLLATDPVSRRILSGGVLYPCQVIFLPDSLALLPHGSLPASREDESSPELFRILSGYGVICSKSMTLAEQQMLSGLARVVNRIPESTPLRYLSPVELDGVLCGEASSYREVVNSGSSLVASDMAW